MVPDRGVVHAGLLGPEEGHAQPTAELVHADPHPGLPAGHERLVEPAASTVAAFDGKGVGGARGVQPVLGEPVDGHVVQVVV